MSMFTRRMCQGGDIVCGNGLGGESVYGGEFADENFLLKHDSEGILSSANMGQNTNQSQFFITLAPYPSLDGENVAFGKVVEGMDVVKMVRIHYVVLMVECAAMKILVSIELILMSVSAYVMISLQVNFSIVYTV